MKVYMSSTSVLAAMDLSYQSLQINVNVPRFVGNWFVCTTKAGGQWAWRPPQICADLVVPDIFHQKKKARSYYFKTHLFPTNRCCLQMLLQNFQKMLPPPLPLQSSKYNLFYEMHQNLLQNTLTVSCGQIIKFYLKILSQIGEGIYAKFIETCAAVAVVPLMCKH